jgi:hypothetical protein
MAEMDKPKRKSKETVLAEVFEAVAKSSPLVEVNIAAGLAKQELAS